MAAIDQVAGSEDTRLCRHAGLGIDLNQTSLGKLDRIEDLAGPRGQLFTDGFNGQVNRDTVFGLGVSDGSAAAGLVGRTQLGTNDADGGEPASFVLLITDRLGQDQEVNALVQGRLALGRPGRGLRETSAIEDIHIVGASVLGQTGSVDRRITAADDRDLAAHPVAGVAVELLEECQGIDNSLRAPRFVRQRHRVAEPKGQNDRVRNLP